jgi:hypothetical protein
MRFPREMPARLLMVRRVNDLHEVSRLQGRTTDQAAVDPIRPGPDGAPKGILILGRTKFALRKFSASRRIYAPMARLAFARPMWDDGWQITPDWPR